MRCMPLVYVTDKRWVKPIPVHLQQGGGTKIDNESILAGAALTWMKSMLDQLIHADGEMGTAVNDCFCQIKLGNARYQRCC